MNLLQRRALLDTQSNPDKGHDYVITLRAIVFGLSTKSKTTLTLRYVPDRYVLAPSSLEVYLKTIGELDWPGLEKAATVIRDDINNEVVPRWLQVSLCAPVNAQGTVQHHDILLEDQQPKWDNPSLLSRLKLL